MQDMNDFMREYLDYYFTQVHTSFPGVVTEYDAKTRRATVQPSLRRRAGNKEFIDFPLLIDVPVLYPGTKKYTIHFPLEKDDEVAVFFSERALEEWKSVGQDGIEDPDPRRYDLCDAYCVLGLQPVEFIAAEEKGLQIIHKDAFDGELISQVLMTDDKIEIVYKEKATVLIEDDHINAKTEKCYVDLTADVAQMANSTSTFKINATKFSFNNGSLDLFTVLDTLIKNATTFATNVSAHKTVGSPALHTVHPEDIAKLAQDIANFGNDKAQLALILEA